MQKCEKCGKEMKPTRNDADDVFVLKKGTIVCSRCYLSMLQKLFSKERRI